MILNSITLKNTASYKTAFINLTKPGLYIVTGLNKDAENSYNGAGKTLLFSSIAEAFTFTKNDLIYDDGFIEISFQQDNHLYKISKLKSNWKIIKNDKDISPNRKPDCIKLIKDTVRFSYKDYYSFIHLSSHNLFPLWKSTPNEKYKFFSSIFGLDSFENIRTVFLDKIKELKHEESYLRGSIDTIKKIDKSEVIKAKQLKEKYDYLHTKYQQEYEKYQQRFAKFEAYKKASKANKKLKKDLDRLTKYKKIKDKLEYYKEKGKEELRQKKINEYILEKKVLKKKLSKLKIIKKHDLNQLQEQLYSLKKDIELQNKLKNGVCPTCGSTVKKIYKDYGKKYTEIKEILTKKEEENKKIDKLQKEYDYIKEEIKELNSLIGDRNYKEVNVDLWKEKYNKNKKQLAFQKEYYNVKRYYESTLLAKVEEPKSFDRNKLDKISKKSTDANYKYKQLKDNYIIQKEYKKKYKKLKQIRDDIIIYEALSKAYSDKGIKVKAMEILIDKFNNMLNKYSAIFPERISFECKLKSNNLSIFAKHNVTHDANTLSGAESKFFIMSCIPALLSLTKMQTDYIILDEIDANMDAINTEYYYKYFLPALQQIIPKVICITTKDVHIEDANYINVVKENGISRLDK